MTALYLPGCDPGQALGEEEAEVLRYVTLRGAVGKDALARAITGDGLSPESARALMRDMREAGLLRGGPGYLRATEYGLQVLRAFDAARE